MATNPKPKRNFFDRKVKEAEVERVEKEKEQIAANKQKAKESKPSPKVAQVIEKGRAFVQRYFTGFVSQERANISIDLDDNFPSRAAAQYADAIEDHLTDEKRLEPTDPKAQMWYRRFTGAVHIATAMKLHASAPQIERNYNKNLANLNASLQFPNRLGTIINNLGKTDLPNENRIRIPNQHLASKKQLILGLYTFLDTQLKEYIYDGDADQIFKLIKEAVTTETWLDGMIDGKASSVEQLKNIGRKKFKEYEDVDWKWTFGEKTYSFRLPKFDFKEDITVNDVTNYLNNAVFKDFTWDGADLNVIVGSLVFQVATPSWLRNTGKTMAVLDKRFNNTIIKDTILRDIMYASKIWNINDYIDDDTLDEMLGICIHKWNTAITPSLSKIISFTDFKFTEFGTDAQLVTLEDSAKKKSNQFEQEAYIYPKKTKATSKLKITEHGAIQGIMVGFTKRVEITDNFELQFNTKNRDILNEYLKADFVLSKK